MGKQPIPSSNCPQYFTAPHPPLKPGSKNFVVEIISKDSSFFISIPLHPNTDPHCFFWHRGSDHKYLTLRVNSISPDSGLHITVTIGGICNRIAQAQHPGDFQSG